jgi:hypothetical protein
MPPCLRRRHSVQRRQHTRLPRHPSSSARVPRLLEAPTSPERRPASGCRRPTTNVATPANAVANLTSRHQDLFIAGGGPTGLVTDVHAAVERMLEACEDQTSSVADQTELQRASRSIACVLGTSLCGTLRRRRVAIEPSGFLTDASPDAHVATYI